MFTVMAETEHFAKFPCDITVGAAVAKTALATANCWASVQKQKRTERITV